MSAYAVTVGYELAGVTYEQSLDVIAGDERLAIVTAGFELRKLIHVRELNARYIGITRIPEEEMNES